MALERSGTSWGTWLLTAAVAALVVAGSIRRCAQRDEDPTIDPHIVDQAPPPAPLGTSSSAQVRTGEREGEEDRPSAPPSPPLVARLVPLPGAPPATEVVELAWTSRLLVAAVSGEAESRILGWTSPWSDPIVLWSGAGWLSRLRAPPQGPWAAVMLTTRVENALLVVDAARRSVSFTVRDPRERSVAEPVWSPDGLHVALRTPRGVVILAPETGARTRVDAPRGSEPVRWDSRGLLFRKALDFGTGEYHRWRMGERAVRSVAGAEDFRETPDGRARLRHVEGAVEILAGERTRSVANPRGLSFWTADEPPRWLGRRGALAADELVWLLEVETGALVPLAAPSRRGAGLAVRATRPDGRVCIFADGERLAWGEVTR